MITMVIMGVIIDRVIVAVVIAMAMVAVMVIGVMVEGIIALAIDMGGSETGHKLYQKQAAQPNGK